ncbi:MAG: head-tail connector protein [Hyphomicrobium sp.]|jgi:uncharacterized phiE125 gp8 family phage protein
MPLVMMSGPALEPVTVSEAKAHLRLDASDEDVLIASLILTSRLHVETALGLALITQSWKLVLDCWPDDAALKFPLGPVSAVAAVRVLAADGTPAVVPAASYIVDGDALGSRLVRTAATWPLPGRAARGIEIDFTAGMGPAAADVAQPIRHAILLLVAHWYEHRDPFEIGSPGAAIPASVTELLKPYRAVRL